MAVTDSNVGIVPISNRGGALDNTFLYQRFGDGTLLSLCVVLENMAKNLEESDAIRNAGSDEFRKVALVLQSSGMHSEASFLRCYPFNQKASVVPFLVETMLENTEGSLNDLAPKAFAVCHEEYKNLELVRLGKSGDPERAKDFLLKLDRCGKSYSPHTKPRL